MARTYSSIMSTSRRPNFMFVEGKGSWLKDQHGKNYLDFSQGWAVNCLGHSPDLMINAINAQARKLINPGPAFYNDPMVKLADLIVGKSCFDKVFFANSGAEANEAAIKLARKWGSKYKCGAYEIVTMENAFHGRTLATMSASGKAGWKDLFEPKVPGFPKVRLNDIDAVERACSDKTVAVMVESVQGEAGVIPADVSFLRDLRLLTSEKEILLILDEVQTGMGRTGYMFSHEYYGIEPDLATLGKGLGGGVPISALCAKEKFCCFDYGDQGGTYSGNALATSASLAVAEIVTDSEFLATVRDRSEYMVGKLSGLADLHRLGIVRGRGLLQALVLNHSLAHRMVTCCLDLGLILNATSENIIRFTPSLIVSREEIDEMVEIFLESISIINNCVTVRV